MAPSTLTCDYAPGPDTCVPCLDIFQSVRDDVDSIEDLFSGWDNECSLQYPTSGQLNSSRDGACTTCNGPMPTKCRPIPAVMRGDAYDLQDLIKFSVTTVQSLVLFPNTMPKKYRKELLPALQRELIFIIADLIETFAEGVEITESSMKHQSPQACSENLHRRRILAALQYPFPAGQCLDQPDIIHTWEKRSALRLLPEDDGFCSWRVAKALFRDKIHQFLRKPEVEGLGSIEVSDDIDTAGTYEDMVKQLLDMWFPCKI